jgi:hypothetical protein
MRLQYVVVIKTRSRMYFAAHDGVITGGRGWIPQRLHGCFILVQASRTIITTIAMMGMSC